MNYFVIDETEEFFIISTIVKIYIVKKPINEKTQKFLNNPKCHVFKEALKTENNVFISDFDTS